MKKFFVALCFLSLPAIAQINKATLSKDFPLPFHSFARIPFSISEYDTPVQATAAPGPGIGNGTVSTLIPGGYFYSWQAGFYFFWGQVAFEKSCNGTVRTATFILNSDERKVIGTAGLSTPFNCNEGITLQVHATTYLNAGDWVSLHAFQDAEPSLIIEAKACPAIECSAKSWATVIGLH